MTICTYYQPIIIIAVCNLLRVKLMLYSVTSFGKIQNKEAVRGRSHTWLASWQCGLSLGGDLGWDITTAQGHISIFQWLIEF